MFKYEVYVKFTLIYDGELSRETDESMLEFAFADKVYLPLPRSTIKLVPSVIKAPEIELKPFPSNLKYAFLGANETLPWYHF